MSDALDELYGATLGDFVAVRDRLAAAERAAGRPDAAAVLKKRVKPNVAAWACNQVWFRARDRFEDLYAAGEELRAGQRQVLEGAGTALLKSAQAGLRAIVADLAARAGAILEEAGLSDTATTRERIARTLEAMAVLGRDAIPPGRLERDLDPPGFDALAAVAATAQTPSAVRGTAPAEAPAAAAAPPAEAKTAPPAPSPLQKAAADKRARRIRDAEQALERATASLQQAREREEARDREARARAEEAQEAQEALTKAREAAHGAAAEAARASRDARAAEQELERQKQELARARSDA